MARIIWWKLVSSIVICELAGVIGSFFTASSVSTWYLTLNKPVFNPPNWLFGPVWTFLFLLMGIALYLVWSKGVKSRESRIALTVFGVQLLLNILWSVFFFGLRLPLAAFIEIVVLWLSIIATMILFSRISKTAFYLLIPYILWVSFAAILNFAIFYLN